MIKGSTFIRFSKEIKWNDIFLQGKNYAEPSVFKPENLLREARRQKIIPEGNIPPVCVLDPDGDIVDYLLRSQKAVFNKGKYWLCIVRRVPSGFSFKSTHKSALLAGPSIR